MIRLGNSDLAGCPQVTRLDVIIEMKSTAGTGVWEDAALL